MLTNLVKSCVSYNYGTPHRPRPTRCGDTKTPQDGRIRLLELCFRADCRSVMTYCCVVFVVGVLATLTTARDDLQCRVGELEAVKDNNGVSLCVTSPPNKTFTARSKVECMRVFLSYDCSSAHGANYHSDNRECELHSGPPDSLEQVPNCVYYQVLILVLIFCLCSSSLSSCNYCLLGRLSSNREHDSSIILSI